MRGSLDDRYFEWLYGKVAAVSNRNPDRSYWELLRMMYSYEFVWLVRNDDNRAADGLELRREFFLETGTDQVDLNWVDLGCSVLEMLIALSRRASYETDEEPGKWFWFFIKSLGLENYTDAVWDQSHLRKTQTKLDRLIYRTYSPTGRGGLFPLRSAAEDQRHVELWYQMSAYLLEKHLY